MALSLRAGELRVPVFSAQRLFAFLSCNATLHSKVFPPYSRSQAPPRSSSEQGGEMFVASPSALKEAIWKHHTSIDAHPNQTLTSMSHISDSAFQAVGLRTPNAKAGNQVLPGQRPVLRPHLAARLHLITDCLDSRLLRQCLLQSGCASRPKML